MFCFNFSARARPEAHPHRDKCVNFKFCSQCVYVQFRCMWLETDETSQRLEPFNYSEKYFMRKSSLCFMHFVYISLPMASFTTHWKSLFLWMHSHFQNRFVNMRWEMEQWRILKQCTFMLSYRYSVMDFIFEIVLPS